ncbi:MAG: hypothetical protein PWP51_640 [Clostridiales bacterium]|nr:hypothetical protein [Clostridiales bacterium]MDN5298087.1 hypothetical protein [Clostridiales bacterium]
MFRNREIRQFAVLFFIIAVSAVSMGFAVSMTAGMLAVVYTVVFGVIFFVFTKARYKKIAQIADQIDLVLHNENRLYIDETDEGELSILQSEIRKMTLRIREQNNALRGEKTYLADSLADIAHQLRTPLTSVSLILSLLEDNPDENERKKLVREIKTLFIQMNWLLDFLLKISRLDADIVTLKNESIRVRALLDSALQPFLIAMEIHGIVLKMDVPETATVNGDFGWLSEAVQNILKNCIESVGDHGHIEITCEDNPLFLELTIHDSGGGFNNEDLPNLFDRFYRGKNANASGYGIGLALSKLVITKHGGMIAAKNHFQGGAVFVIRFTK